LKEKINHAQNAALELSWQSMQIDGLAGNADTPSS